MDIETLMKVQFPEELERFHPITFNILEHNTRQNLMCGKKWRMKE